MNPAEYFKHYRTELGFPSQDRAKNFLSASDIIPDIDIGYAKKMIDRVADILRCINSKINVSCRKEDIEGFIELAVFEKFQKIKSSGLIRKLNNQGRRPEEVLFSWTRGSAIGDYFEKSISIIFETDQNRIKKIGDDNIDDPSVFRRTPKADYIIETDKGVKRLEFQSGFKGVNDIKEHKIREAKRIYEELMQETICMHIDIFNGQAAFVNLSKIENNDDNWVTRQQMEGQTVLSIDQNYFKWRLLDEIPSLKSIDI
jgi:hypothetical protein